MERRSGFWLAVVVVSALCIVALARPQTTVASVRRGGVDFVVLLDGSASMYTRDIAPDRWQRAVRFLRTFGESLSWKNERIALALFAQIASPQVRLTKDPNTIFFFLDHLDESSPFRLQDDATWDTNIGAGMHWGIRLLEKDEELLGKSNNAKAFVVISDGQAWSGEVATAITEVRRRRATIYVVGVGTTAGADGFPCRPRKRQSGADSCGARPDLTAGHRARRRRRLLRARTAVRSQIASRIVSSVRRRTTVARSIETRVDMHWLFLFAASLGLCLGAVLLRDKTELSWYMAASVVAMLILVNGLR